MPAHGDSAVGSTEKATEPQEYMPRKHSGPVVLKEEKNTAMTSRKTRYCGQKSPLALFLTGTCGIGERLRSSFCACAGNPVCPCWSSSVAPNAPVSALKMGKRSGISWVSMAQRYCGPLWFESEAAGSWPRSRHTRPTSPKQKKKKIHDNRLEWRKKREHCHRPISQQRFILLSDRVWSRVGLLGIKRDIAVKQIKEMRKHRWCFWKEGTKRATKRDGGGDQKAQSKV